MISDEAIDLGRDGDRRHGERWPYRSALVVTAVGLLVTATLVATSALLGRDNDRRLLQVRAREVGAVLAEALPTIQTPLASATALADATGGAPARFTRFMAPYAGSGPGHEFVSASLWRVSAANRGPIVVVGEAPVMASAVALRTRFFARAAASSRLSVVGLLNGSRRRLGYAFSGVNTSGPFAAYAETALPASRYSMGQRGSAFADLNYALYLGRSTRSRDLLVTSDRTLPLPGYRALTSVAFGDSFLTVQVSARAPLSGNLPQRLPWAIAVVGLLLSLGAAALTARLIARRRESEQFAGRLEIAARENRRLYAEQRTIAQTLQRALLPDRLPSVPGLEIATHYEAGVAGVEVGGDWYDVIPVGDGHALLIVGDVSGRGVRAAATMASLRYGTRAYALQGDAPSTILAKLSGLVSIREHGLMATVLCAHLDVPARELTVSSAGHLPPLARADGRAEFIAAEVGVPVGVERRPHYPSTTVRVAPGGLVMAFTDGLVERRGESIDIGLERLRAALERGEGPLDAVLAGLARELRPPDAADDSAIACVRWESDGSA